MLDNTLLQACLVDKERVGQPASRTGSLRGGAACSPDQPWVIGFCGKATGREFERVDERQAVQQQPGCSAASAGWSKAMIIRLRTKGAPSVRPSSLRTKSGAWQRVAGARRDRAKTPICAAPGGPAGMSRCRGTGIWRVVRPPIHPCRLIRRNSIRQIVRKMPDNGQRTPRNGSRGLAGRRQRNADVFGERPITATSCRSLLHFDFKRWTRPDSASASNLRSRAACRPNAGPSVA